MPGDDPVPGTGRPRVTTNPPAWFVATRDPTWRSREPDRAAVEFHRGLPGYAPTPIVDLPAVADALGIGRVVAKDESTRLGLPAFKALGASWAVHRAVPRRGPSGPLTFVAATDGNHGRAVARFARRAGHQAAVFVPDGVPAAAVEAIGGEGAPVRAVDGDYDAAVAAAAAYAAAIGGVLIQDTAWDGYTEVPRTIVDGYGTLVDELDEQLGGAPDLVVVPTGVGSLLQAAIRHYRRGPAPASTMIASVEPVNAACVLHSLRAGKPVTVPTGPTSMAGLNCGTVSALAWPDIAAGLDAAITVTDEAGRAAAARLAASGVPAGPCGAAPLAALDAIGAHAELGAGLGLGDGSTAVLLVTEGADANPWPAIAG
ncbi:MAG: pyridoxal-phosphate dependent enzyme [Acidimicrobiales bacterium]